MMTGREITTKPSKYLHHNSSEFTKLFSNSSAPL
jgi:hypothetical protein